MYIYIYLYREREMYIIRVYLCVSKILDITDDYGQKWWLHHVAPSFGQMMLIDALGQGYNEIHGALVQSPEDVVVRHI